MRKQAKVYFWTEGSRLKADPSTAGSYIEKLARKHGGDLTREQLLDEVDRDEKSPLRVDIFNKSARAAAREYYLERAGYVLRSLSWEIVNEKDKTIQVRAMVMSESSEGRPVYKPIEAVLKDPELREAHMEAARSEYLSYRRRWEHLSELAALFRAGDRTFKAVVLGYMMRRDME